MKETFRPCKKCGKPVGLIESRLYRKILVDAEAVEIKPDAMGEQYVTMFGVKLRGREVKYPEKGTKAYRPHRCGETDEV